MKKSKQVPNIQPINSILFRERQRKKISLKEAAAALKISSFHLDLIEKGYINVSKKLRPRFIEFYHLNTDIFDKNTTYIDPINVVKPDLQLEQRMRAQMARPRVKIISGVLMAISLGVIIAGAMVFTQRYRTPRNKWTANFTSLRQEVINKCDDISIDALLLDTRYSIIEERTDSKISTHLAFTTYNAESNCANSKFNYECTFLQNDFRHEHEILSGDVFKISANAYNKKKYFVIDFTSIDGSKMSGVIFFTDPGVFTMNKVTFIVNEEIKEYTPGSIIHNRFKNILINDGLIDRLVNFSNDLLVHKNIELPEPPYNFYNIMNDCLNISRSYVFTYNSGFNMMLFASIVFVLSLANFLFSFSASAKPKKKKEEVVYVKHRIEYTEAAAIAYRSVPNDTRFTPIFPEFIIRILGLTVILLSSIGLAWATTAIVGGSAPSMQRAINFNGIISNFLIAGTTLLFFIKLDVFHKKTNRELVENVLTLFFIGLIYYIAEILIYHYLTHSGTIFSDFIDLFSNFFPGNIVWNLMFYSLLFLFLFTVPERIKDRPDRVLLWRLGSLIPSLILIFSFLYEMFLKKYVGSPYYISFIFFSKGAIMSAFALVYLYALFFLQQYVKLRFGDEFSQVYLNSRRYAFSKNILACITIVILVLIDLFFRFKVPDNPMKLGNNWSIALLIPFILLYRPHIGKRNSTWDFFFTISYVVCLASGPIISISTLLNALNFGDWAEILH